MAWRESPDGTGLKRRGTFAGLLTFSSAAGSQRTAFAIFRSRSATSVPA
jgi:hypothetical protein